MNMTEETKRGVMEQFPIGSKIYWIKSGQDPQEGKVVSYDLDNECVIVQGVARKKCNQYNVTLSQIVRAIEKMSMAEVELMEELS